MVTNVFRQNADLLTDPFKFKKLCWPHIRFYDKQAEIIRSIIENRETVVPAGNMLGKDFVAGFLTVWFFVSRHPCRVVTTSVDANHLNVLWGEVRRFLQESKYPLTSDKGGPLIVNHLHLRKQFKGEMDGLSYAIGRVSAKGEGLQGHHIASVGDDIPRTLFIADEASGLEDVCYTMADTWANRILVIGNPWPCQNFFYRAVRGRKGTTDKGGDIKGPPGKGYYRKVIRIKAEDSPNVRLAAVEKEKGKEPSGRVVIPGVKPYDTYVMNRKLWDTIQQCVSLDADFYEGAEVLMFPPEWMQRAAELADDLDNRNVERKALAIGIDTAEGGDSSVWTAVDRLGVIDQYSIKTGDTSVIPGITIAFGRRHKVPAEKWAFDRGGGGKQHADILRKKGYNVRTVGFGEGSNDPKAEMHIRSFAPPRKESIHETEIRNIYRNRRAEMYGLLRNLIDPNLNPKGFAIPSRFQDLREQLAPIPLNYDDEGVMWLLPKGSRYGKSGDPREQGTDTLYELLGRSPDEADSTVLAVYCMLRSAELPVAGAS